MGNYKKTSNLGFKDEAYVYLSMASTLQNILLGMAINISKKEISKYILNKH